jgi:PAS domain S-box-containing protein
VPVGGRLWLSGARSEREATMNLTSSDSNVDVYRLLVNQAPDAIIYADRQGVIQVWNNAAAELLGYRPDEAIGRSLDIIIPEHLRRVHGESFGKAMASGQTKHGGRALKTRAVPKAGHKLYVSLAFAVVKDREGTVIGAMATAREFTEKP